MKQKIFLLLLFYTTLDAFSPIPGTPLWCIEQQTGQTIDLIESTVEQLINSPSTSGGCSFIEVGPANISSGIVSVTASGNYCLTQDIIANVVISGTCIYFDLNEHQIGTDGTNGGQITIDGSFNTITNGSIVTPTLPSGVSALTIASTASNIIILRLIISTSNGFNGFNSSNGINNLGANSIIKDCIIKIGNGNINFFAKGSASGNGINTTGVNATIEQCSIATGNGGGISTSLNGFNGGTGIIINGINTLINHCSINTGDGGPGTTSLTSNITGTSGNGGIGILVQSNSIDTRIKNTIIKKTGNGGQTNFFIGSGLGPAAGGNGGNGIQINNGAQRTFIYQCSINNTGQPTSGQPQNPGPILTGVGGKAVLDSVPSSSSSSVVFKNIAANIANPIKFDLAASGIEKGIFSPNPPIVTSQNPWANIFL